MEMVKEKKVIINYLKLKEKKMEEKEIKEFLELKEKEYQRIKKYGEIYLKSLNKIEYTQLSIFKKFIAKLIYAKVPFKVNIAELCREFGVSHPTLATYLEILQNSKLIRPVKKQSNNISKKPEKLLFGNTNLLYTYADEFGIEVDIGTVRETFFASCFDMIYYSDIGDFSVDGYIFEIGGKNKKFTQIKDTNNSYLVIDTDYTMEKNKIPLWLFGLLY